MKKQILIYIAVIAIFSSVFIAEPSFNGNSPGCAGSGCHTLQSGIVSASPLNNLQIQVTVSGSSGRVSGELVDNTNTVVDVVNRSNNSTFTLTAPQNGDYTINAGYSDPNLRFGTTTISLTPTSINFPSGSDPLSTFELMPNHPNPFNNQTIIRFAVPKTARVELNIFDVHGKHIRTLTEDYYNKGIHSIRWNGRNDDGLPAASGVYLYQLTSTDQRLVRSLILSK